MRKASDRGRVLARVLAEELAHAQAGSGNPVYGTVTPNGRKDVTDAANGDTPPPE